MNKVRKMAQIANDAMDADTYEGLKQLGWELSDYWWYHEEYGVCIYPYVDVNEELSWFCTDLSAWFCADLSTGFKDVFTCAVAREMVGDDGAVI